MYTESKSTSAEVTKEETVKSLILMIENELDYYNDLVFRQKKITEGIFNPKDTKGDSISNETEPNILSRLNRISRIFRSLNYSMSTYIYDLEYHLVC